ncbi:MAG: glycosyltransferase family 39 protein [Mycoplasmatota bacterium]|nr:glycosyltransferase family 39 protein [Mycoplasmatota bacterium]
MKRIKEILNTKERKMLKIDYLIIGIIIILYTILSFINLGSMTNPQTFKYLSKQEALIIELRNQEAVLKTKFYNGDVTGPISIYSSQNRKQYDYLTTISEASAFSWVEFSIPTTAKYLKIVAEEKTSLGEISFYNNYRKKIEIKSVTSNNKRVNTVTDEPQTVPTEISYLNSTYFDEIYFARTAYDYKVGIEAYEWVHPPLGKMLQAIPVLLFNNFSPFFYRLMGNIVGIIMIYVMYLFGKLLFQTRKWSIVAALLMFLDTFHFTQTRIGTVDSFLVLFIMLALYFMYRYVLIADNKKTLFLSGLFFSLSIMVKWTGFLAGLALAIIYFSSQIQKRKPLKETFLYGTCFFVIIPLILYFGIYLIYPNNQVTYTNSPKAVITQTSKMYEYHSTLEAEHAFSSPWYSWPISYRPVWYYTKNYSNITKGTIIAVGNVVIWWMGILSFFIGIYLLIKKKDKSVFLLLTTILSLWLPYIFIGRVMFLYHFFPVLPFLMLLIIVSLKNFEEKTSITYITPVYLLAVLAFFLIYYPVISGLPMSKHYVDTLKLFSSWYF